MKREMWEQIQRNKPKKGGFAVSRLGPEGKKEIERIFPTTFEARRYVSKNPKGFVIERVWYQTYAGYFRKYLVTFIDQPDQPTFEQRIARGRQLICTNVSIRRRYSGEFARKESESKPDTGLDIELGPGLVVQQHILGPKK